MAKVGVRMPCYKIEGKDEGKIMGKAIKIDAKPESNDTKLYADDEIAESDTSFKQGSALTVNTDDLEHVILSDLLGHTIDEQTKELICNKDDIAPFVGFGFYGATKRKNVQKFVAKWYTKVMFKEPEDTNETKGESTTFNTPTIEGLIYTDADGNWKHEKEFDTAADAVKWLKEKIGMTVVPDKEIV